MQVCRLEGTSSTTSPFRKCVCGRAASPLEFALIFLRQATPIYCPIYLLTPYSKPRACRPRYPDPTAGLSSEHPLRVLPGRRAARGTAGGARNLFEFPFPPGAGAPCARTGNPSDVGAPWTAATVSSGVQSTSEPSTTGRGVSSWMSRIMLMLISTSPPTAQPGMPYPPARTEGDSACLWQNLTTALTSCASRGHTSTRHRGSSAT